MAGKEKSIRFHLGWISKYRSEIFGLAILSIMVFHFSEDYSGALAKGLVASGSLTTSVVMLWYKAIGSVGVDIFVFLSGMGLWFSYSKKEDTLAFYGRRLTRLLPSYLIAGIPLWLVVDVLLRDTSILQALLDLSFITFLTQGVRTIWFIGFILVMSLIFPVFYHIMKKRPVIGLIACYVAFAVLLVFLKANHPSGYGRIEIAFCRVPVFILGVFMARYIKADRTLPVWFAVITILLLTVFDLVLQFKILDSSQNAKYFRFLDSVLAVGLIFLIVGLLALLDQGLSDSRVWGAVHRFLQWTGAYSLELYVIHVTIRKILKVAGVHTWKLSFFLFLVIIPAFILSPYMKRLTNRIIGK